MVFGVDWDEVSDKVWCSGWTGMKCQIGVVLGVDRDDVSDKVWCLGWTRMKCGARGG